MTGSRRYRAHARPPFPLLIINSHLTQGGSWPEGAGAGGASGTRYSIDTWIEQDLALYYYTTTTLLHYYSTTLYYYTTTILLHYCSTMQLYFYTAILLYCYTTILLLYYYYTTILQCVHPSRRGARLDLDQMAGRGGVG